MIIRHTVTQFGTSNYKHGLRVFAQLCHSTTYWSKVMKDLHFCFSFLNSLVKNHKIRWSLDLVRFTESKNTQFFSCRSLSILMKIVIFYEHFDIYVSAPCLKNLWSLTKIYITKFANSFCEFCHMAINPPVNGFFIGFHTDLVKSNKL